VQVLATAIDSFCQEDYLIELIIQTSMIGQFSIANSSRGKRKGVHEYSASLVQGFRLARR
jgi:hypothetical protein